MEAYMFIIFFFFLVSTPPISLSQPDKKFRECQPMPCGNVGNISYPFWSDSRPSYCGNSVDEFKLKCPTDDHEFPSIQISTQSFNVTHIDNAVNNMNLVPVDYNKCFSHTRNSSIDIRSSHFHYDSDVTRLTLFYDCPRIYITGGMRIHCPLNKTFPFYNPLIFVAYPEHIMNDSLLPEHMKNCGHNMEVPVSIRLHDNIIDHSKELETALDKGFRVRYDFNESCKECQDSEGICGSNGTIPFLCFCFDGDYPLHCPSNSSVIAGSGGLSNKLKIVIVGVVTAVVVVLFMLALFYFYRRRRETGYAEPHVESRTAPPVPSNLVESLTAPPASSNLVDSAASASSSVGVHLFTHAELEEATDNFHESKVLGDGSFGIVYYGELKDGRQVAVKRLLEHNPRRAEQFINEVQILARLNHVNLVSLYGCTSRHSHELLLVYEYVPNGTVADHLHGDRAQPDSLPWNMRMNIAIQTASAIEYLHASDIIHRDVKTDNILLDNHFVVKVADFGLSRLFPNLGSHISTTPQGTPGYVDPEYQTSYQLSYKSDVYSFGVVLIELISSLPAVDIARHQHEINLSAMALSKIQSGALHELVDQTLGFDSDLKVKKMINSVAELAFRCLQSSKEDRPSMVEVVQTLWEIETDGKHKRQPRS